MSDRERINRKAAEWLIRRDRGLRADEQAELQAWLRESVAHLVAYLRLDRAWRAADGLCQLEEFPQEEHTGWARWWSSMIADYRAVAAALLVSVMLAAVWGFRMPEDGVHRTVVGGREEILLRDGSRITLNTDSEVRIDISDKERRVELRRGEAFFDVSPDPARPFIVQAGSENVVAVGTQFSVRREKAGVRILVAEGRVRVERSRTELSAGALAYADDIGVIVQSRPVAEILDALKWREGFVIFQDGTPLDEAVKEINRYNTRQLRLEGAQTAEVRVGGEFHPTDLDSFIRLLKVSDEVVTEDRGNDIILRKETPAP